MNITLAPEMESLVARRVASGKYRSADDVVREGLRLLQEREELGKPDFVFSTLEELEAKLAVGVEQLERGEGIPGETGYRRVRERFRKGRMNI